MVEVKVIAEREPPVPPEVTVVDERPRLPVRIVAVRNPAQGITGQTRAGAGRFGGLELDTPEIPDESPGTGPGAERFRGLELD